MTKNEKFWLKLTRRVFLWSAIVFVALLVLAVYAVMGDSTVTRFIGNNDDFSRFLLGVMRTAACLLPISIVAHGAVGLYVLLRS